MSLATTQALGKWIGDTIARNAWEPRSEGVHLFLPVQPTVHEALFWGKEWSTLDDLKVFVPEGEIIFTQYGPLAWWLLPPVWTDTYRVTVNDVTVGYTNAMP